jgi:hypothetical protein
MTSSGARICTQCRLGVHDHCACTDCDVCAHRFDHDVREATIATVEEALIELLSKPINLIPMKPTQAKQARDDMHYGMQKALTVVRALKRPAT